MRKQNKQWVNEPRRLWRVEWYHRHGYQAPAQYAEGKRQDAIQHALKARFADFRDSWNFILVPLRELVDKRAKQYEDDL